MPEITDSRFADIATSLLHEEGAIKRAWGASWAHVRGVGLAENLPTPDELLRTPLLGPPFVTLWEDHERVPVERFSRPVEVVTSLDPARLVDVERIESELTRGCGVKFNRLELWCPAVAELSSALQAASGRPVRVWGFYTPPNVQALPWHRDTAHNVELQILGRKRWKLGGAYPSDPSTPPTRVSEPIESVTLDPDDVLYLPHGFAHCAVAEEGASFHVSIAMEGATAGAVRSELLKMIGDELDLTERREVTLDDSAAFVDEAARAIAETLERLKDAPATGGDQESADARALGLRARLLGLLETSDPQAPTGERAGGTERGPEPETRPSPRASSHRS